MVLKFEKSMVYVDGKGIKCRFVGEEGGLSMRTCKYVTDGDGREAKKRYGLINSP